MKISEVSRRNILDALRVQAVNWSGRLEESEFLSRIFDLHSLPSHDFRFENAAGDIWQHRIRNSDWDDHWVFSDSRFDLLRCDDSTFLRFLCEMLHPVVRADAQEATSLVQLFNQNLAQDGFEIVEASQMSGRPVYAARLRISGPLPSVRSARTLATEFNAEYLTTQVTRLEASIPYDPELAIGTAKELVETCCKTILHECGKPASKDLDLPQLVKQTCRELGLAPEDVSDHAKAADVIKRLLSNLATVTQGIAELWNRYGTGHGRDATALGLGPRHAKLAAGAATTLVTFLFETHRERKT